RQNKKNKRQNKKNKRQAI
ncbi:uncharacterized protein HPF20_1130, partial [Helicobacter pylori]